jgi:hypothetical protein
MPESTPIELRLENGNVIKAENAEEALKVAAKMIEDNSKAYRETKATLDTLQSSYQTLEQRVESLKPKPEPTNGFDKDKYYQLLHDDPITAQNYLDAQRFGIAEPRDVPGYFTGMYEKVSALDGQTLAAGFVNQHQDFPQDADSAKALTQRVVQLKGLGHPTSLDTMELAYTQLVHEGKIKPMEAEPEKEELPPSLGGSGSALSEAEVKKAEAMSNKELEAFLKSKGML